MVSRGSVCWRLMWFLLLMSSLLHLPCMPIFPVQETVLWSTSRAWRSQWKSSSWRMWWRWSGIDEPENGFPFVTNTNSVHLVLAFRKYFINFIAFQKDNVVHPYRTPFQSFILDWVEKCFKRNFHMLWGPEPGGHLFSRYRPNSQNQRPSFKKGFMQGRNSRPEKEEKEAEYKESWPGYARTLQDRWVCVFEMAVWQLGRGLGALKFESVVSVMVVWRGHLDKLTASSWQCVIFIYLLCHCLMAECWQMSLKGGQRGRQSCYFGGQIGMAID